MAKRLTDTDLWDKEWFMALPPRLKCAVKLIRDKCDLAGVWSPNWALLNIYIKDTEPVTEDEILAIDGGKQFAKMAGGKIFVLGFIQFQNGTLTETSPVHKKIQGLLKTHSIIFEKETNRYKYPIYRVYDSVIVEVEVLVEEKVGVGASEELPEFKPEPIAPEPSKIQAEYYLMDSQAVAIAKTLIVAGKQPEALFLLFQQHYKTMNHEVTEQKHGTPFHNLREFRVLAAADIQARAEAGTMAQTPLNYLKPKDGEYGWRRDIHRGKVIKATDDKNIFSVARYYEIMKKAGPNESNAYLDEFRAKEIMPIFTNAKSGNGLATIKLIGCIKKDSPGTEKLMPKIVDGKLTAYYENQ